MTEREPGGLKTVRPRSLLVAGKIEEITVEAGTTTEETDWPTLSSLTAHDLGFPALGGRVSVGVGVVTEAVKRSVLPVAIYPTRAHINPKL